MRVGPGPQKVDYLAGKKLQNYLELVLVLSITLEISSKNTKICMYLEIFPYFRVGIFLFKTSRFIDVLGPLPNIKIIFLP
jgi:hypothetical protein